MSRAPASTRASLFLRRTAAMASKEVIHIRRDPRTLYLVLGMPVVLLLIFGFGVSFDVERIPLAVADQDRTEASRRLATAFLAPGEFVSGGEATADGIETLMKRGRALAGLVIPAGYGRHVAEGGSPVVQLVVDGADGITANAVLAKADAIARAESLRLAGVSGLSGAAPLQVKIWTRFNPTGRSALFMVPGLAAYILAISAVLLTALTIATEWERGSMEQLFASPVGRFEIILGKLLPYLVLGLVELLLVLAVGATVFDVPINGSVLLVFGTGLLFLVGMLGQGLFISVVARDQLVATQAGALSAILPAMLLSGMLFPIENMPRILQWISSVIPARYMVHALRSIMLKGNGVAELWPDLLAQAVFAVVVLTAATRKFRRRIA